MLYRMRKDKEKAIELRKLGKSYREIHAALKIPRATLSDWFSGLDWSEQLRQSLARSSAEKGGVRMIELNKVRGQHLARAYGAAEEEARVEFERLKYHPAFIAGVMLYWGEGTKSPKAGAQLANSDPEVMRLFYFFLRNICCIPEEKISGHLLLYPDLDEKLCRAYWSKQSGMPWERFTKSVRIQGRHRTRRLTWGICLMTVTSVYFKRKMLVWLDLLPKELMKREYYANIGLDRGSDA